MPGAGKGNSKYNIKTCSPHLQDSALFICTPTRGPPHLLFGTGLFIRKRCLGTTLKRLGAATETKRDLMKTDTPVLPVGGSAVGTITRAMIRKGLRWLVEGRAGGLRCGCVKWGGFLSPTLD